MNQNSLLAPILLRFSFFILNLYFTVRVTSYMGWNFMSFLLAMFATREFVATVRMGQVYYHLSKNKDKDKK